MIKNSTQKKTYSKNTPICSAPKQSTLNNIMIFARACNTLNFNTKSIN